MNLSFVPFCADAELEQISRAVVTGFDDFAWLLLPSVRAPFQPNLMDAPTVVPVAGAIAASPARLPDIELLEDR
ncbi:MAG: hypothetical protein KF694_01855 [Mesorhizobium sp.]|nr:hypothetical protein [Mesorhizobium sp.]